MSDSSQDINDLELSDEVNRIALDEQALLAQTLQTEVVRLQLSLNRSHDELEFIQEEAARLQSALEETRRMASAERETQSREIASLVRDVSALSSRIQALEASWSWKVTAPVRKVLKILRGY